ncbi:hypothetical protein SVAN01_06402 [Stagonosporopsis vannaccii]|nr:hypothetical protein SVAN01_06402 [Stagonosporopsis vannaccii]
MSRRTANNNTASPDTRPDSLGPSSLPEEAAVVLAGSTSTHNQLAFILLVQVQNQNLELFKEAGLWTGVFDAPAAVEAGPACIAPAAAAERSSPGLAAGDMAGEVRRLAGSSCGRCDVAGEDCGRTLKQGGRSGRCKKASASAPGQHLFLSQQRPRGRIAGIAALMSHYWGMGAHCRGIRGLRIAATTLAAAGLRADAAK